jgi:hypothetical protein
MGCTVFVVILVCKCAVVNCSSTGSLIFEKMHEPERYGPIYKYYKNVLQINFGYVYTVMMD